MERHGTLIAAFPFLFGLLFAAQSGVSGFKAQRGLLHTPSGYGGYGAAYGGQYGSYGNYGGYRGATVSGGGRRCSVNAECSWAECCVRKAGQDTGACSSCGACAAAGVLDTGLGGSACPLAARPVQLPDGLSLEPTSASNGECSGRVSAVLGSGSLVRKCLLLKVDATKLHWAPIAATVSAEGEVAVTWQATLQQGAGELAAEPWLAGLKGLVAAPDYSAMPSPPPPVEPPPPEQAPPDDTGYEPPGSGGGGGGGWGGNSTYYPPGSWIFPPAPEPPEAPGMPPPSPSPPPLEPELPPTPDAPPTAQPPFQPEMPGFPDFPPTPDQVPAKKRGKSPGRRRALAAQKQQHLRRLQAVDGGGACTQWVSNGKVVAADGCGAAAGGLDLLFGAGPGVCPQLPAAAPLELPVRLADLWAPCATASSAAEACCLAHDACYGSCSSGSQDECDAALLRCQLEGCAAGSGSGCDLLAALRYQATRLSGAAARGNARKEHCACASGGSLAPQVAAARPRSAGPPQRGVYTPLAGLPLPGGVLLDMMETRAAFRLTAVSDRNGAFSFNATLQLLAYERQQQQEGSAARTVQVLGRAAPMMDGSSLQAIRFPTYVFMYGTGADADTPVSGPSEPYRILGTAANAALRTLADAIGSGLCPYAPASQLQSKLNELSSAADDQAALELAHVFVEDRCGAEGSPPPEQ